ncbi:hypothetical protein B0T10DRAFT_458140 [Thelonectria olida]|uniref:NACHT-NTPase and P-loop NTPases N-terminal domain-containing protein n=1 Tax=Thelonectria olida TaxID=1576542 RepID=A0A9P8W6P2_9HYPO|nr:hypothetical protein B0T10DRAFT_458140 [Thelonectria olida]
MEVIASAASVAQLLSQTINLAERILDARRTVRGYPKLLKEYEDQLEDLRKTLTLVRMEKELQTANVMDQTERVHSIAQELQSVLEEMSESMAKKKMRQYFHAITSGKRHEKGIAEILDRLDRAKTELRTRILLVHVGITGSLNGGFRAMLPLIQRVDRNVQSVLGSRLLVSSQLDGRWTSPEDDGPLLLNEEDLRAIGCDPPADTSPGERSYVGNLTFDQAQAINGDVGAIKWNTVPKCEYRKNEARGNSLQVNGNVDLQSFQQLIAGRR